MRCNALPADPHLECCSPVGKVFPAFLEQDCSSFAHSDGPSRDSTAMEEMNSCERFGGKPQESVMPSKEHRKT